jgi:hypothetical protein
MMPLVLALCGFGVLVCVVGVVLHLRTLRRLHALAQEVDRRVMPYLSTHALALHVDIGPPLAPRTPESIIDDACALAQQLLDLERKAEDMALGPTQNISTGDISRPR